MAHDTAPQTPGGRRAAARRRVRSLTTLVGGSGLALTGVFAYLASSSTPSATAASPSASSARAATTTTFTASTGSGGTDTTTTTTAPTSSSNAPVATSGAS